METTIQNEPFNLIHKKVVFKETIRTERDWYVFTNIIILVLIVLVSIVSFLYKLYLEQTISTKAQTLVSLINTNISTSKREMINAKITMVNDKYSAYEAFSKQNFNASDFNIEVAMLYQNLVLEKYSIVPSKEIVDLSVRIPTRGYTEFPRFLVALNASEKFNKSLITNAVFSGEGDAASVKITLQIPKNKIMK